ncbi:MAG: hypothetical protein OHK93_006932 [Ramalina farinacea]|uniref:Uncharacterized protein n=1 Tax=Ramalina farinacea TaxID=258253 RepID=A0AA43QMF2_9LECA|nr:hypothetical protein [Ramalina farinacea]
MMTGPYRNSKYFPECPEWVLGDPAESMVAQRRRRSRASSKNSNSHSRSPPPNHLQPNRSAPPPPRQRSRGRSLEKPVYQPRSRSRKHRYADYDRRSRCSDDSSSSGDESDSDSDTEERVTRLRKARNQKMLATSLACITTVAAANNIYQSTKAHETRRQEVANGELSLEEAQQKRRKHLMLDLCSLGVAAVGINNAHSGWKRVSSLGG